jgi:HK97 family phage portal protein
MPWQWPWTRHDRALFQVGDLPVASTYAAVPVNPSTAMQHSAVWACTNLIAGSISTLPLAAYRRGERDPLPDLPPILRAPSAGWSLPEFLYALLRSLLVRGNAYGLIVDRAGAGLLPSQVELLAPERVGVQVDGRVIYRIHGQEVDPASIWHVRAFTTPGQVEGLSPIGHARQAIGLGLGAEKYAAKFFGQSAIPSGVLTSDQDIRQERADQIKARWRDAHAGNRDIAVLGNGAKFQAVTIPPEQAQFLETTQANVRTMARYFGVQPELIGADSGNSLTYANVEQRAIDFLQFCLRPWLVRVEAALSALLSSTTTVKFNAAALVRTDLLTRYQATRAPSGPAGNSAARSGSWRTSRPSPASTTRKAAPWHDARQMFLSRRLAAPGQWRWPDPGRPASPVGRTRPRGRPGPPRHRDLRARRPRRHRPDPGAPHRHPPQGRRHPADRGDGGAGGTRRRRPWRLARQQDRHRR